MALERWHLPALVRGSTLPKGDVASPLPACSCCAAMLQSDGAEEGKAPSELENLCLAWQLLGSPRRICPYPDLWPAATQRGSLEMPTPVCVPAHAGMLPMPCACQTTCKGARK